MVAAYVMFSNANHLLHYYDFCWYFDYNTTDGFSKIIMQMCWTQVMIAAGVSFWPF